MAGTIASYSVTEKPIQPLGFERLTSLSTAQSLSPPAGAAVALVQAEGSDVRWRDDGTAPTAAIGMQLFEGDLFLYRGDLSAIQFIEAGAGAILSVSYYSD